MSFIKGRRVRQVLICGWKDAGTISSDPACKKTRISIFVDIWHCFRKFYLFSNQYKDNCFWTMSDEDRGSLAHSLGKSNQVRDRWIDVHYEDWKFLSKYTSLNWQKSPKRIAERRIAYARHYGLSEKISVQYGVTLICEHFSVGKLKCGNHILFARNCDIDYTGDLTLEDYVELSEGVKILTHNHDVNFDSKDVTHGCVLTPLIIRDRVWIGARAMIMPGVREIGRGAVVSANSVVSKKVPPYAVVMGNPARIIGFKLTPEEVQRHEASLYSSEDRIDLIEYEKRYNRFLVDLKGNK